MLRLAATLIGISLMFCSLSVFADSAVRVNALNYPAWLVRNYQTLPLQAGTRLQSDDLIRTGEGGRVQLRLTDGSALRLGESSRLIIGQAGITDGTSSPVSLRVLRGVFRVSSNFFEASTQGYPLQLNLGDIDATIERADIWGRADLAQEAVCLLRGRLDIGLSSADGIAMDQALSCFVKPKNQAPLPVDRVDLQQHQLWMAETDLKEDSGIVTEQGQWQLVLISLTDAGRAEQLLKDFHQQGFAVRDKTVVREGRTLHRLLLPGFTSIEAALSARARLEPQLGVSETWVWKAQ